MSRVNGCTIVTRRELARARVLAATFRRAHPDASFTVLLAARAGGPRPPEIPGARVLPLGDVAPEAGELLAAVNPPAVAPLALLPELVTFLGRESLEPLVYLACGQRVLAPMTLLATALGDRPLLLVARTNGEPPVGLFDADPSAASFSSALLALQPGPDLSALLSHWPMAFADHDDGGRQAAGAWLERLPSLAEVAVLRDPGYGADARSLAHRELDTDAGGTLRVGGRPLVTLDLSEVQTDEPRAAFDGSDRIDLSSAPGLAALVDEHAAELREQGLDRDARLPEWEFERLPNGVRMTRTIRELLAAARRAGAVGD